MAKERRAANLAGLAALGAVGYQLMKDNLYKQGGARAPYEDRNIGAGRPQETFMGLDDTGAAPYRDVDESGLGGFRSIGLSGPLAEAGGVGRSDVAAASQANMPPPAAVAPAAVTPAAVRAAQSGVKAKPAPARNFSDRAAMFRASERAYRNAQAPAGQPARPMTREEMIAQIPTGGYGDVSGGERITGNEFTRNMGNILNAPVPGLVPVGRAAKAFVPATKIGSKIEEGREMVTNPLAWAAGPKGMKQMQAAENAERKAKRAMDARRNEKLATKGEEDVTGGAIGYKRGGSAGFKSKPKKMASGGLSSASKRADGIASKGKTKGKIY